VPAREAGAFFSAVLRLIFILWHDAAVQRHHAAFSYFSPIKQVDDGCGLLTAECQVDGVIIPA